MKKEQTRQGEVRKAIRKLGGWSCKVMRASEDGVPDVLGCKPTLITPDMVGQKLGLFLAMEMKDDYGELRREQTYQIKKIKQAGGIAGLCRGVDDLEALCTLGRGEH